MRISQRLLILFIVIVLGFGGFFYLFFHIKREETKVYLESDLSQRRSTIDTIFKLQASNQMAHLETYSRWDDMVHFSNTRSVRWADDNLGSLTKSFGYSLVQTYDVNHKLIYNRGDDSVTGLQDFRVEPEVLDSLSTKKKLYYNILEGSTIFAVAVAGIQPSSDSLRSIPPTGYLLIAEAWDYPFLSELAKSLNYDIRISFIPPVIAEEDNSQYNTIITRPVKNWYDKDIAWLVFYSRNPFLNQLRTLGNLIIFGTMGFILIFLVIQFVLIQQWISSPLRLISRSLKENDPEIIRPIDHRNNEFADIASLIERFFTQKQELVLEIEERKRTEERLREIEEQTRKILITSPESIIVTDLDGLILSANDETLRLIGVETETVLTRKRTSIFELIPAEYRYKLQELISDLGAGAYVKNLEITMIDTLNQQFPALLSASVIADAENEPSKLVFITRDLSELKSLEIKLRQSQKMESIGTLAGGIAHDFNNIITIIAGYIALSAGKIDGHIDAREDMDEALKACLRAKSLIGKILTFSRQGEVTLRPIVLADIIEDAIPMIRASIPTKIAIVSDISSYSYTVADPTELQQVLMNLSSNAFHAMQPDGGKLSIILTEVNGFELIGLDHAVVLESSYLHLRISDTGRGIPQDIINRVFDPYFSTKSMGEGTGLGLSIVHGIINGYHGFVNLTSSQGEGCQVDIYLPVTDHIETIVTSKTKHVYPFIPARIMMVDDETALAEIFSITLSDAGYHVQAFSDSMLALAGFSAKPDDFDLIISDITMPNLDGIQLAAQIKAIRDIPIILYTGFCDKQIQLRAEDVNVHKLLNKPLLPDELVEEVKELLYLLSGRVED